MNKEELVNKVSGYLIEKNIDHIHNSIKYVGFRESFKQIDGSEKSVYVISFMKSINNQQYDSNALCFVHIDANTNKLSYIIGPQSFQIIEE